MMDPLIGDTTPAECEEPPPALDRGGSVESHFSISRSLNPRSLENSKVAQLVRYGAYLFIWVIGIVALVKLLTDFSGVLKPLVLAALVSSILEWLVQFWEFFFWKVGNFLAMLAHKLWIMVRLALLYLYGGCHGLYSMCCVEERRRRSSGVRERSRPYLSELCDWTLLLRRWHGSYAGQNSLLRFVAVITTLALVAALSVGLYTLTMSNVSSMLAKLNGYKDQLLKVMAFAHDNLNQLPAAMPRQFQNETLAALQRFEKYLGAESMVHEMESYVSSGLTSFISQTESVAVALVFFILYTFLWLFVPMHVNSHAVKASTFTILPWGQSSQHKLLRSSRARSFIEGEDEPLTEVQEHLYKVIWQYFLAMVIINAVYAGSVLTLLIHLGVDMSGFIAIASFFLGFIPELGTIISTVLPIVLVALEPLQPEDDSSVRSEHEAFRSPFADWSVRSIKLTKVLLGMIVIKLAVANVLTSIIMGRNRTLAGGVRNKKRRIGAAGASLEEEVKETHPVIILFAVVISGEIWGAVGMLISVPVISFLRLAANIWFLIGSDEGGSSRPVNPEPQRCESGELSGAGASAVRRP